MLREELHLYQFPQHGTKRWNIFASIMKLRFSCSALAKLGCHGKSNMK